MEELSRIKVPVGPGPWKPIETRLRTYVSDPADAATLAGESLTHTDWMPDNVLISRGRAWLVDWAWATPVAAWTDPAFWLLRLIARGHTVEQAEAHAARLPAYATADPAHVDLFARANVRMWNEIEQQNTSPWAMTIGAHRPHMGTAPADRPVTGQSLASDTRRKAMRNGLASLCLMGIDLLQFPQKVRLPLLQRPHHW